ncbi:hypothetical protein [Kribbella sp. NBC_00359]|uniref:hypothetical protein n=1 Tax=Kribbella sp. NBC_00359 TaxID=2975966 RepID=UPI002E20FA54
MDKVDSARIDLPRSARAQARERASADSAGTTRVFAAALRTRVIGFSVGFSLDENVQQAILATPANRVGTGLRS